MNSFLCFNRFSLSGADANHAFSGSVLGRESKSSTELTNEEVFFPRDEEEEEAVGRGGLIIIRNCKANLDKEAI
jgi:hypothetical protein